MTWINSYIDFLYDESGEVYSIVYDGTQYYFVKNLQGDVVQIRSIWGTKLVEYEYDAWGNCEVVYSHSSYGDLAEYNPIRYRGYYYDFETGFYYLESRYYDPQVKRFINADDVGYLGASGSALSLNLYAYCENNPVIFSDPTGNFVLTALLVGAVAGGAIGGASGLVVTYGALSVGGTAAITGITTVGAKTTEVISLQAKKSANDGDNGWQAASDCMDSVINNSSAIIGEPVIKKGIATGGGYLVTAQKAKQGFSLAGCASYLASPANIALSYAGALGALNHMWATLDCKDPIRRANDRGYRLK